VFPYTITDEGTGLNATAYVHITIPPPALLPAVDDYYVGVYNTPRVVNVSEGILRNDGPGPTNGTLTAPRVLTPPPTAHGNVTGLNSTTGGFVFTPTRGFSGNTSFVYGAQGVWRGCACSARPQLCLLGGAAGWPARQEWGPRLGPAFA